MVERPAAVVGGFVSGWGVVTVKEIYSLIPNLAKPEKNKPQKWNCHRIEMRNLKNISVSVLILWLKLFFLPNVQEIYCLGTNRSITLLPNHQ